MNLVIDASATLAWYFEDERTEAVQALLVRVAEEGAVVPSLWRYEVANGLQIALRRNRIDAAYRDRALANLEALAIQVDPDSERFAWSETVQLAMRHQLTVYDAAYLELAQRRRLPLASLDSALRQAAASIGIELIG